MIKCFSPFMKNEIMNEPKNLFSSSLRNSDSNFTLFTEKETEKALETLEDLLNIYGADYFKNLMKEEIALYGTNMQLCAIKKE